MVIVNQAGEIQMANAEAETLFGYSREQLVGQQVEALIPERFRSKHPNYRELYFAHPRTRPMGEGLDLWVVGAMGGEHEGKATTVLSVTDTGRGIKVEDQQKLFDAFQQIDSSHANPYKGTGLGLYLCRKLATRGCQKSAWFRAD